jgi:type IV secretion system protein VirB4
MYLFHRVEQRLDGTPAIIVVDEGWKALDDEVVHPPYPRLGKDHPQAQRHRRLRTQSAEDALTSRIASAIRRQAAYPDLHGQSKAQARDYIAGFGLTQHEYDLVRSLPIMPMPS